MINLRIFKTIIPVFILLTSCSQSSEFFIGKWRILHVVENNKSIDLIENWMHLKNDGTFESYDGHVKKMEYGTWSYTPEDKRLFIDANGEAGDSQWNLSIKNDTLIFKSTTDNVSLISKKVK